MRTWSVLFGGIGIGAGAMYALDPDRGRRRRALARDKASHLWHAEQDVVEKGMRDLRHRAEGAVAGLRKRIAPAEAPDPVLEERVRAAIGRAVSHPGSLEVHCDEGRAILAGPVLANEAETLLDVVRHVPGVREIEDGLVRHDHPDDIPGLQGAGHEPPPPPWRRENWPPAFRIVAGGLGAGAGAYGLARGGGMGAAAATAGAALISRAALNRPLSQIVGLGHARGAVELQKTLTIDAPAGQVFALLSEPETFPQFMEHVREVRAHSDGKRSHWILEGRAGARLDWDAEITRYEKNRAIGWQTLPGSVVEHTGHVLLEPQEGKTRVTLRLTYAPPAGVLGHAVLNLLGHNPKRMLDEDMVRLKSLLEEKKTTAHHREVGLDDLH